MTSSASVPVTVSPAAADKLVVTTPPGATATAGQPFSTQLVISEEDQYGNLETGDNSTQVTASLANGTGPLQGTTNITLKNGVATFTNLADNTAETIALSFSGGGLTAGRGNRRRDGRGPAKLVIKTEPSATATAGQAFSTQPVIWEEDQYGNLETGDSSTVVTASLGTGTGPLQGTVHETLSGGVATFTNLADDTAEAMTLKFAAGSLTSSASPPIVMSPSTPTKLVITTSPSATATAGQRFATQPVISEEDRYGNLETTDNSTVVTASPVSGSGPLQGTLTATVSGGVARFTSLGDSTPETLTLKFTDGNLTSAASSTIQVAPGATPPARVVAPTVLDATVVMTPKTKKKKAAFSGFNIQFSAPMNLATVSQIANYQLEATTIKKKVTRLVPAKFRADLQPVDQHRHPDDHRQEPLRQGRPAHDRELTTKRREQPGRCLPEFQLPLVPNLRKRKVHHASVSALFRCSNCDIVLSNFLLNPL